MKCPNCNVNLLMTERQGLQIDYCPECRGVWLERGKLDTILERSATPSPAAYSQQHSYADHHDHDREEYGHHGRKRRGWLSDLFD